MNPFSRSLIKRLLSRRQLQPCEQILAEFVPWWDRLEALVIRVYKARTASEEDQGDHQQVRAWLQRHYPEVQGELEPHWRAARAAGVPATEDPFLALLAVPDANGFVRNWSAMQTLPAAREALNQLMIARLG